MAGDGSAGIHGGVRNLRHNRGSGSGGLTITGIPAEYNGKYAFAEGEQGYNYLIGAVTLNNDETGTAGKISNGSVTLKVFTFDEQTEKVVAFKGSGTAEFEVLIFNTASLEDAFEDESSIAGFGSVEVTFTDGTGSGVWMQDEEVEFISVTADGEEDTETTTELTLSFDKAITGLSAGDITITTPDGARGTKGTLSGPTGSGPVTYTLGFAVTVGGTLRVAVEKDGYEIFPYRQTVTVYYADEEEEPGDGEEPVGDTLAEKLAWLKDNAVSNTTYTLEVTAAETLAPQSLSYTDTSGVTVILKGIDDERVLSLSGNGSLFTVGSGIELVLDENITLKGRTANDKPLVYIYSGGTLEMKAGAKMTGNNNSSINGSGVYAGGTFTMNGGEISDNTSSLSAGGVEVSGGTFTMNGGTISGNKTSSGNGGGVYVYNDATFTMSGGTISDNEAGDYGGGVRVSSSATVTMTGGTISDNTASNGGGMFVSGTFTMSGGTISDNEADDYGGGVYVYSDATFTMNGGTISGNTGGDGGGVYVHSDATFTMKDGTISGNEARDSGGGVYMYNDATFTMSGGEISGNEANNGGGVHNDATFTMTGGEISGNEAGNNGGGVHNNATFTMTTGSEISGNEAGSSGGGVYVAGSFTMTGGAISGNTARSTTTAGGGVYVYIGTFTLSGGTISGNAAVVGYGGGVYVSGTFRIENGTIYGLDATPNALKNTASTTNGGAALYNSGTAQRGTFSGGTWTSKSNLPTMNTELTIRVVDGELN